MTTKNPFLFSCSDLPRRAGEMREYELTFDDHEPIGVPLLMVPSDGAIYVDLRVEAVEQGVLATGAVSSEAIGECTRCLDPVSFDIDGVLIFFLTGATRVTMVSDMVSTATLAMTVSSTAGVTVATAGVTGVVFCKYISAFACLFFHKSPPLGNSLYISGSIAFTR